MPVCNGIKSKQWHCQPEIKDDAESRGWRMLLQSRAYSMPKYREVALFSDETAPVMHSSNNIGRSCDGTTLAEAVMEQRWQKL
jgi:hypothetical protein